jgi:dihydrofolate reductase
MQVSAIVAQAKNRVIGRDNSIPWYLPADFAWFKKCTLDHHIIMGRKCFESIGRPLPKRTNIVITRDPFFVGTGLVVARSVEDALEMAAENGEKEAFIIGGGQIYQQSMNFWDKIYLTDVQMEVPDGDVFFPKIDTKNWQETFSEKHAPDEKNEWAFTFRILERL